MELGCGLSVTSSHVITVPMNITHGHTASRDAVLGSVEKPSSVVSRWDFPAIGVSVTAVCTQSIHSH